MNYSLNGKIIRIPDNDIKRTVDCLGISKEEAIKVWLEDEGYIENEEQERLCKKAKDNRITATIHQATTVKPKQKTQKERVKKDNPIKEMVIAEIAKILPNFAENIKVLNISKLISFTIGNETYEIDLKQKRKTKK